MKLARTHWLLIGLLSWTPLATGKDAGPKDQRPRASLEVHGEPEQPAGAPIILLLTVKNTGKVPIIYWCGGPGEYPDASDYSAQVEHAGIRPALQIPLFNAQQADGSGHSGEIAPGKSLTFPAALPPLSAGSYLIRVEGQAEGRHENDHLKVVQWPATVTGTDFTLRIRADAALAARLDELMIKRVRANDHFAQYLSSKYPRKAVREALVKDLDSADAVVADRAADGLWAAHDDAGDAAVVAAAFVHHLDSAKGEADTGLINKLLNVAGRFNSIPVRDAVTRLAAARPPGGIRESAIQILDFPAGIPLVRGDDRSMEVGFFRSDSGAEIRPNSYPFGKEVQRDPAVLDALLKIAQSMDAHERKLAFVELGAFLSAPRAVAALRIGIRDRDQDAQNAAAYALTQLERSSTTQPAPPVHGPPREADQ